MKLKLKKKAKIILLIVLASFGVTLITLFGVYKYQVSPVSNSKKEVIVEIPSGTSRKKIGKILQEKGLIHNENFFYLYVRLQNKNNLKASTYKLSPSMNLSQIVDILAKGNSYNPDVVKITFKEGLNTRQIAKLIESKTIHNYEDIIAKMTDMAFIDLLIAKYWFLTDEIKNPDIYYPLEGYLFPNTYEFKNKEVTVETIVITMLDEMERVLKEDKKEIEKSSLSIHQLLTLASIVELEGVGTKDRDMIAQVFYNRLNASWNLGSDVTTCYGFKVEIKDCNDNVDYSKYNPYNTRNIKLAGKLPVGPICNPSKASILGSISPKEHSYYYFVADKYKRVYFSKTKAEHDAKIKEIKSKGEWPW